MARPLISPAFTQTDCSPDSCVLKASPHRCHRGNRLYGRSVLFCVGWPPPQPNAADICADRSLNYSTNEAIHVLLYVIRHTLMSCGAFARNLLLLDVFGSSRKGLIP